MRYLKKKIAYLGLGLASVAGTLSAQDATPTIDSMGIDIPGLATTVLAALGAILLAALTVNFSIWVVKKGVKLFGSMGVGR